MRRISRAFYASLFVLLALVTAAGTPLPAWAVGCKIATSYLPSAGWAKRHHVATVKVWCPASGSHELAVLHSAFLGGRATFIVDGMRVRASFGGETSLGDIRTGPMETREVEVELDRPDRLPHVGFKVTSE
jgi:hypothetical protein